MFFKLATLTPAHFSHKLFADPWPLSLYSVNTQQAQLLRELKPSLTTDAILCCRPQLLKLHLLSLPFL